VVKGFLEIDMGVRAGRDVGIERGEAALQLLADDSYSAWVVAHWLAIDHQARYFCACEKVVA